MVRRASSPKLFVQTPCFQLVEAVTGRHGVTRSRTREQGGFWRNRATSEAALLGRPEGQEVWRAFDGVPEAPEELLKVGASLDEIDIRGVYDQEVGGGVPEEKVFVGASDLLDVLERDLSFVAGG